MVNFLLVIFVCVHTSITKIWYCW